MLLCFSRFNNINRIAIARTGNETVGPENQMIYGERVTIVASGTTVEVYKNNQLITSATSSGVADNGVKPLALFTNHEGDIYNRHCSMVLYRALIKEGDKVIAHFIPCKNSYDIIGLYDTERSLFFYSIGTNHFIGG